MKLGIFIAVGIAVSTSAAHGNSRRGDHAATIAQHREAYVLDSDPIHLVHIARAYRAAGNLREALAHFCSYIYVDAAGPLADEASANARALSAQLGNPTQSDRDACSPRSAASPPAAVASVDMLADVPPPPRITKREVAGMITLGGSVASLGLALLEARELKNIRADQRASAPGTDQDALADRERSASLRQKLFLGAGGGALLTGGLLYVLGRNDRIRAERAYVAPSLTTRGGGLVLGGRF